MSDEAPPPPTDWPWPGCRGQARSCSRLAGLWLFGLVGSWLAVAPVADAQTTTQDVFLHGSGGTANPPTLFLNLTASSGNTAKYKDSPSVNFAGGNLWKAVGTWRPPAGASGAATLQALTPLHVWLGLKNSDDQGTRFDLYAEVVRNGAVVSAGLTRCITGLTRNANQAQEVTIPFSAFSSQIITVPPDTVGLRIWTRSARTATTRSAAGTATPPAFGSILMRRADRPAWARPSGARSPARPVSCRIPSTSPSAAPAP